MKKIIYSLFNECFQHNINENNLNYSFPKISVGTCINCKNEFCLMFDVKQQVNVIKNNLLIYWNRLELKIPSELKCKND